MAYPNYPPPPRQQAQYPPPHAYPPPRRSGRGWIGTCLIIFLVLACLSCACVAAVAGGAYYLVSSGQVGQRELYALVGQGSGEINIANLSDADVRVTFNSLDAENSNPVSDEVTIQPNEISGFAAQQGRYQVDFSSSAGAPSGTCTLEMKVNDYYQFIAVPEGIAIVRNDQMPQNGGELDVATSSLCQK